MLNVEAVVERCEALRAIAPEERVDEVPGTFSDALHLLHRLAQEKLSALPTHGETDAPRTEAIALLTRAAALGEELKRDCLGDETSSSLLQQERPLVAAKLVLLVRHTHAMLQNVMEASESRLDQLAALQHAKEAYRLERRVAAMARQMRNAREAQSAETTREIAALEAQCGPLQFARRELQIGVLQARAGQSERAVQSLRTAASMATSLTVHGASAEGHEAHELLPIALFHLGVQLEQQTGERGHGIGSRNNSAVQLSEASQVFERAYMLAKDHLSPEHPIWQEMQHRKTTPLPPLRSLSLQQQQQQQQQQQKWPHMVGLHRTAPATMSAPFTATSGMAAAAASIGTTNGSDGGTPFTWMSSLQGRIAHLTPRGSLISTHLILSDPSSTIDGKHGVHDPRHSRKGSHHGFSNLHRHSGKALRTSPPMSVLRCHRLRSPSDALRLGGITVADPLFAPKDTGKEEEEKMKKEMRKERRRQKRQRSFLPEHWSLSENAPKEKTSKKKKRKNKKHSGESFDEDLLDGAKMVKDGPVNVALFDNKGLPISMEGGAKTRSQVRGSFLRLGEKGEGTDAEDAAARRERLRSYELHHNEDGTEDEEKRRAIKRRKRRLERKMKQRGGATKGEEEEEGRSVGSGGTSDVDLSRGESSSSQAEMIVDFDATNPPSLSRQRLREQRRLKRQQKHKLHHAEASTSGETALSGVLPVSNETSDASPSAFSSMNNIKSLSRTAEVIKSKRKDEETDSDEDEEDEEEEEEEEEDDEEEEDEEETVEECKSRYETELIRYFDVMYARRMRAAQRIQCAWRCSRARIALYTRQQILFAEVYRRQKAAAMCIEGFLCTVVESRRLRTRLAELDRVAADRALYERQLCRSVDVIERYGARFLERRRKELELCRLLALRSVEELRVRLVAAVLVQRWWRIVPARKAYWRRRNDEIEESRRLAAIRAKLDAAATQLQRIVRGRLARCAVGAERRRIAAQHRERQRQLRDATDLVRACLTEYDRRCCRLARESMTRALRMEEAAAIIQLGWRAALSRQMLHNALRRCRAIADAVLRVQRAFRRFRAGREVRYLRRVQSATSDARIDAEYRAFRATLTLQSFARLVLAKAAARRRRAAVGRGLFHAAATIQRVSRGGSARRWAKQTADHRRAMARAAAAAWRALQERIVAVVGAFLRGKVSSARVEAHRVRRLTDRLYMRRLVRHELRRDRAATVIQRAVWRWLARRRGREAATRAAALQEIVLRCIVRIQTAMRGFLARRAFRRRRDASHRLEAKRRDMEEVMLLLFLEEWKKSMLQCEHDRRRLTTLEERGREELHRVWTELKRRRSMHGTPAEGKAFAACEDEEEDKCDISTYRDDP